MAKKIIGVVGLKKAQISLLNKKYSKAEFIDVNDNNFFQKKILKINALVVLYEYPVKKNLSKFLTIKHKEFKNLYEEVHGVSIINNIDSDNESDSDSYQSITV